MPEINIDEVVSHLKEYLPVDNILSDSQLASLSTNVVNSLEENDDSNYSEALCKSLKVAAVMNASKYAVDEANLIKEEAGDVAYTYSDKSKRDAWKDFEDTLPSLCPYLPKGGYNLPSAFGLAVKKGSKVKLSSCREYVT